MKGLLPALKRFQLSFLKVTAIASPLLLVAIVPAILISALLGWFKPGNWAPVIIALSLLGLALLLPLLLLTLILVIALLEGNRQRNSAVAIGAACGFITNFFAAYAHSIAIWPIASLALLALASWTLTTNGGPVTRIRKQTAKIRDSTPGTQGEQPRTRRKTAFDNIDAQWGIVFVFGALLGAGLFARLHPDSNTVSWQSALIGGVALLLFSLATRGLVYLQDSLAHWPLLPSDVVWGFGIAYGFGSMVGGGVESMIDAQSQYTWLIAVGGGFAFLFFYLVTQGFLLLMVRGIREQANN
jgi:hypothetical protein